MKIYVLLVCLTIGELLAGNIHAQSISLRLEGKNLSDALAEIESKTDFHFFYNTRLVDVSRKVDINVNEVELEEVLQLLLHNVNVDYKLVKNQIVLFPKGDTYIAEMLEELISGADENTDGEEAKSEVTDETPADLDKVIQDLVTGSVTDQDGLPLPGVNILVKGTNTGTQTDFDGNYTISATQGQVLVFSFVGQRTTEVAVGASGVVNVQMEDDAQALEEVIVVAYGAVKKEAFVGSATQISAEKIEGRSLTNISQALEGASSGVQFTPGSGQPGSSPEIRIRGFSSVNLTNEPIYVVDGAIFTGNIASLNMNDIESFTILKDAASTSLYGAGAANGVVMITTKKGKSGKSRFALDVSQGITQRSIPEYNRVNPKQYYEGMWEALRNSRALPGDPNIEDANQYASDNIYRNNFLGYNPFDIPGDQLMGLDGQINPNANIIYDDLDWQKELFKTGYRSNIDFSYQGGTENSDFFASINYLNESAYVINSDFERVSARLNVNTKPFNWFKTGLNIAASNSVSRQAVDGATSSNSLVNPFRTTRIIGPIYPIYQHDPVTGEYILDDAGNRMYDHGDGQQIRGPGATPGRHPIQENLLNINQDKNFNINTRGYAEFYFWNDFTFTTNLAFDKRFYTNNDYWNNIVGDAAPAGRARKIAFNVLGVTFNQLLRYNKGIGRHNIEVLAGHESRKREVDRIAGTRRNQIVDGNIEFSNYVDITELSSYFREFNRESFFSRANYDYDNRYYLSGSIRTDGSSRFHPDRRWGTFWSAGGAWRISNEAFLKNARWIDQLKLRASYGEVGNDGGDIHSGSTGLSFFAFRPLYELGENNASEAGILQQLTSGNPDLKWEANAQTDIALEFSFFNGRLSGEIEYYNRKTEDLIFERPVPVSAGFENILENIGDMYNRGIEITIGGSIIQNENFNWRLNVNASTIKNRMTRLPQEEIIVGTKKLMVGRSIYDYWLRQWHGVDPADGAPLFIWDPETLNTDNHQQPLDDPDVREVDGRLVTTNQNKAQFGYTGTAIPDLFGSISNVFSYKGLSLTTMFTYQIGGKTYDTNYSSLMDAGQYGAAWSTDILNRWQQPGDRTNVPRVGVDGTHRNAANAGTSSRWLVDSDFIALRQAGLAYTFPGYFVEKIGVDGLRVYMNGENIFAITKRKGLEPTQNFNGTTQNRFTPARILTLGLNVQF